MEKIISFVQEEDENFDSICTTNDPEEQFALAKRYIEGLDGYSQDKELGMKYLRKSMVSFNLNAIIYYSMIFCAEQDNDTVIQAAKESYQKIYGPDDDPKELYNHKQ